MTLDRKDTRKYNSKTMPARKTAPQTQQNSKNILTANPAITLLLAPLIISAFYIGTLTQKVNNLEQVPALPTPTQIPRVDVSVGHLPVLGKSDAKVTVIEFADFQCPFCEQWFKNVEPNLIKDYVNTGKVKFAFRHYAFLDEKNRDPKSTSAESTWAAEASECANDQGKFWEFHNYLYDHQGTENSGTFTKVNLEGFAQVLELNTSDFNQCLESDKHATDIANDLADGQKAGVNSTPTTFVNGRLILGAQPYTIFKAAIDAALSKK